MAYRHLSAGFLRYRFEYASLVWDSIQAVGSKAFLWKARGWALLGLPLLLSVPAAILYVGSHPFGNPYAFGAALGLWPILLESLAYKLRQAAATSYGYPRPDDPSNFDFFLFAIFTALAVGAAIALFSLDTAKTAQIPLGILWGVALAGGVDFVRSAVGLTLAATGGYPLYGPRPLKPVTAAVVAEPRAEAVVEERRAADQG
jgi:hypothetical protein